MNVMVGGEGGEDRGNAGWIRIFDGVMFEGEVYGSCVTMVLPGWGGSRGRSGRKSMIFHNAGEERRIIFPSQVMIYPTFRRSPDKAKHF